MLSIGKLVAGQEAYYAQQVAQGKDDYYKGKGEAKGRWRGSGADELELSGEVDSDVFGGVIAGKDPRTGDPLRDTPGKSKVAAFDLTFSAPKSVSLMYAFGGDELASAMIDSHEAAVEEAMGYLEEEACKVRRGKDGVERLQGGGFVSAAYRHRMSRAQDPQLHTHVVTANIAKGSDGRWSALDSAQLYRFAKAAGTLYQAHLRHEVRERLPGLSWERVINGLSEVEQVPVALRDVFSKRAKEIDERMEELGLTGKDADDRVAVSTRAAKADLDERSWFDDILWPQSEEHGWGRERWSELAREAVRVRVAGAAGSDDDNELRDRLFGPEGLTEMHNSFAPRHLQIEVAGAHRQGAAAKEVRAQTKRLIATGPLRQLAGAEVRHTTEELLEHERDIVAGAARRRDEGAVPVDAGTVELCLADRAVPLTDEQAEAVRGIAAGGHGVVSIEALAGTGKTTIAGALRDVYEAHGATVVGTAHTARAVRELEERAGVDADRSGTLASLRMSLEQGGGFRFEGDVVLIVDEASMASTRDVSYVFAEAERSGIKVIAIGDSGQLPAVEAGGWLGSLTRRYGSHHLTEVMRQRDPVERKLLARLHGGSPVAYIREKYKRGELTPHKTHERGEAAALEMWAEHLEEHGPKQTVIVARDNNTRERLNQAAREVMREQDRLGEDVEVAGMKLAVGERVIARRNDRLMDVDNGMRGTVTEIDKEGEKITVETDGSGTRELGAGYVANNVEYAYALTGHGMQGGTVEWATAVGSVDAFSKNWSYTALSRARSPMQMHVIDEDLDEDALEEVAPKLHPAAQERMSVRLARRMRTRDDEDLALDQLPEERAVEISERAARPQEIADLEQIQRGSRVPERVLGLFGELREIEEELAQLPLAQAKALEMLEATLEVDARALDTERERLASLPAGRERTIASVEVARMEKALELDREREANLRESLPAEPSWRDREAELRERARDVGREIGVARQLHLEASVAGPPEHIVDALGRPPADPRERGAWEKAVRSVETYRFNHQVTEPAILGREPDEKQKGRASERERAAEQIVRAQRTLGLELAELDDLAIELH